MTSGHRRSADVATLIDRFDAALNAHDLDAIASMHDDAIVFHNHHGQRARRGRDSGTRPRRRDLRALASGDDFAARSGPRVPCTPTTVAN